MAPYPYYKHDGGWGAQVRISEVLPLQKKKGGGSQIILAILKEGTNSFEIVLTRPVLKLSQNCVTGA